MGTPRPHGGSVRVSNGHANRKPATRRPRLMGKNAAEPNTALSRFKKQSRLSEPAPLPLDDAGIEQMGDVPDEEQINQAAGPLTPVDRTAFARVRELLADQLGSAVTARLWLITACSAFGTTPLAAIAAGRAKQ